jgi:hypothetical protein
LERLETFSFLPFIVAPKFGNMWVKPGLNGKVWKTEERMEGRFSQRELGKGKIAC